MFDSFTGESFQAHHIAFWIGRGWECKLLLVHLVSLSLPFISMDFFVCLLVARWLAPNPPWSCHTPTPSKRWYYKCVSLYILYNAWKNPLRYPNLIIGTCFDVILFLLFFGRFFFLHILYNSPFARFLSNCRKPVSCFFNGTVSVYVTESLFDLCI